MLSVILPTFNKERQIRKVLHHILNELDTFTPDFEIIIVNDGSRDLTLDQINHFIDHSRHRHKIKIVNYPLNVGKGFALSYGFTQSVGDIVIFMDADLDIHPRQIRLFVDTLELFHADMVIGSKRHPLSRVHYPSIRKFYSWGYQQLIRLLFHLNLSDTQVGLKVFRRPVLDRTIPRMVVKQWAYDLELFVIAQKLGFTNIVEAPIDLDQARFSSAVNYKTVYNMFLDTLAIWYRKNIIHYYDRPLRRSLLPHPQAA